MLQINTRSIFPEIFFEKVKKVLGKLVKALSFEVDVKKYVVLNISPSQINLQIISKHMVEIEELYNLEDCDRLIKDLYTFRKFPISIVLSQWELSIKYLDLSQANFFDRYYAQKSFKNGEFKPGDIVCIVPSSHLKDVCLFVGVHQNNTLDEILFKLSKISNLLMGVKIEEQVFLKHVIESLPHQGMDNDWRVILLTNASKWRVIVGCGQDLVLSRTGVVNQNNDYLSEIMETIRYLPRLGLKGGAGVTVYAEQNLLSRLILGQGGVNLVEFNNIEKGLYLQSQPEPLIDKIKKKIKFNFFSQNITLPHFFEHKIFYDIPRFFIILAAPFLFFLSLSCIINGMLYFYYSYSLSSLNDRIINMQLSASKTDETGIAEHFLKFYESNPVVFMKELSKELPKIVVARKIDWKKSDKETKVTITFKVLDNKMEQAKKDLNQIFEKKFSALKKTFKQDSKNILHVTLVEEK